ncbi:MAG: hypothetical protein J6Y78_04470 [Paludibacteraceae bacterium]|nr:hypothetical protein [Paludibacteraceae bacterium]
MNGFIEVVLLTEKRLTLGELQRQLDSVRGYMNMDSKVRLIINEGREYIHIDDDGLIEVIKVKE